MAASSKLFLVLVLASKNNDVIKTPFKEKIFSTKSLLGADEAMNKAYIGIGLTALDSGMSFESLMKAGLEFVLGSNPDSENVINLFYENLVGSVAPESIIKKYSELIDLGELTPTDLGIAVAEHNITASNINLVGLVETGVEYI